MRKLNSCLVFVLMVVTLIGSVIVLAEDELWDGESYAAFGQLQQKWAKKFFFDQYTFHGNERVLDVGSGDGRISAVISDRVPNGKVVGIDQSKSMVSHATKHHAVSRKNLVFYQKDAGKFETFSELKDRFDLVVSFHVLHWIESHEVTLQGIAQALKPEGIAFLRFCSDGFDPIQDIADEWIQKRKWKKRFLGFKDPMIRFNQKSFIELAGRAGLQVEKISESKDADSLKGRQALETQIRSWLPHLAHLSEKKDQDQFLKEIIDQYYLKYPSDGKEIILYDSYLEVVARPSSSGR